MRLKMGLIFAVRGVLKLNCLCLSKENFPALRIFELRMIAPFGSTKQPVFPFMTKMLKGRPLLTDGHWKSEVSRQMFLVSPRTEVQMVPSHQSKWSEVANPNGTKSSIQMERSRQSKWCQVTNPNSVKSPVQMVPITSPNGAVANPDGA
jgi:hypothetical protein